MTRDEFYDRNIDLYSLYEFCSENDIPVMEDVIPSTDLDGYVCDDIRDSISRETWDCIRDLLNDIDEDSDFYVRRGVLSYETVDEEDDYEQYLTDAYYYCVEHGIVEEDTDELEENDSEDSFESYSDYTPMSGVGYSDVYENPEDNTWAREFSVSAMSLVGIDEADIQTM